MSHTAPQLNITKKIIDLHKSTGLSDLLVRLGSWATTRNLSLLELSGLSVIFSWLAYRSFPHSHKPHLVESNIHQEKVTTWTQKAQQSHRPENKTRSVVEFERTREIFNSMYYTLQRLCGHKSDPEVLSILHLLDRNQKMISSALFDLSFSFEQIHEICHPFFSLLSQSCDPSFDISKLNLDALPNQTSEKHAHYTQDLKSSRSSQYTTYKSDEEYFSAEEDVEINIIEPLLPLLNQVSLYEQAQLINQKEPIFVYKFRLELTDLKDENDFAFHVYWIRFSFTEFMKNPELRNEFYLAGKNLLVELLDMVNSPSAKSSDFEIALHDFFNYLENYFETAIKDVSKLEVRFLNIFDYFIEYTLIDSLKHLDAIPSGLTKLLQWSWESAKSTIISNFVIKAIDDKIHEARENKIDFRVRYLSAMKVSLDCLETFNSFFFQVCHARACARISQLQPQHIRFILPIQR